MNKNERFLWVSENPEIAKVDEYGKVMGVRQGETTITVFTINCLSATMKVKVESVTFTFTFTFSGTDR